MGAVYGAFLSQSMTKVFLDYVEDTLLTEAHPTLTLTLTEPNIFAG